MQYFSGNDAAIEFDTAASSESGETATQSGLGEAFKHPSSTIKELSNLLTQVLDQVEATDTSSEKSPALPQPLAPALYLNVLNQAFYNALPTHVPLPQALTHANPDLLKLSALTALDNHTPHFAPMLCRCLSLSGLHSTVQHVRQDIQNLSGQALQVMLIRQVHHELR